MYEGNIIYYEEFTKIKGLCNNILFPFLIKDKFHDGLLDKRNFFDIKEVIYIASNRCKNALIVLCPLSKKSEVERLFKNMENVEFYD